MPEASSSVTTEPPVLVEVESGIKTITLNRPRKKNAIDAETEKLLAESIFDSAENDDIRVTIVTGAGGDFSAGADLDPGSMRPGFDVTQHLKEDLHPIILAMRNSDKPFIAKVRGNCVGYGGNVALACDMIFASESARFSQIFTRIGLSADGGGTYFLAEALGYAKAYELLATGAMLSAADADRLGLINRVCDDAELDVAVGDIAQKLATGPFVAIRNTKKNLREAVAGTLESTLDSEADSQGINFKTSDFPEGAMAFLQKRKPNFQGK